MDFEVAAAKHERPVRGAGFPAPTSERVLVLISHRLKPIPVPHGSRCAAAAFPSKRGIREVVHVEEMTMRIAWRCEDGAYSLKQFYGKTGATHGMLVRVRYWPPSCAPAPDIRPTTALTIKACARGCLFAPRGVADQAKTK